MASGRAVPSDLFPLVLGFLRENHFDKAARAFGKAAGVTEQDPNAASLLDIFNYWLKSPIAKKQRALTNESPAKKTKKESLSRYESSSENEIPPVKKQAAKPVTKLPVSLKATPGSSDSSSTDTSDSTDSEQERKNQAKKGIVLQSTVPKTKPQKTSKSSDSSSSEDEMPKQQLPKSERAPKVTKLASTSVKPTKAMSRTTNGKAESSSSSSSDETSSEDSSSEENQPVKGKLKKLPQRKNNTAQPLPVKNKPVKKSSSESSYDDDDDDSEHEKLAPKPKRGEYSAVPPPLAIEATKGKAHPTKKTSKKKGEDSKKKEQAKKSSTEGSVVKKASASKSLPVHIQKGHNSSESDSDSSSEEEKKVLVKCSAKAISANCAAKSVPSKKASSSSDSSDSDSSDSVPEKCAVKTSIKKGKKPPAVPAKKVESIVQDKTVHKRKGTKAVKTAPKSSTPVSKPKSSESSSSSSEEETQPTQKAASKLSGPSSLVNSKQSPAESRTSSESSSDEQFKVSERRERKREQNNCKAAKKALKPSANLVGKTPASKTSTSEVLNTANSSSSDEEATKEAGLSPKKRKRKNEQELETPDIKKVKARSPHTFPKSKQQSSPFRRIRSEEIEIDMRVANNSFDAKKGATGDWGEKANDVLRFTKGKSFRHEKTKKKRGSYCGGTISTQINSIKFESD